MDDILDHNIFKTKPVSDRARKGRKERSKGGRKGEREGRKKGRKEGRKEEEEWKLSGFLCCRGT